MKILISAQLNGKINMLAVTNSFVVGKTTPDPLGLAAVSDWTVTQGNIQL